MIVLEMGIVALKVGLVMGTLIGSSGVSRQERGRILIRIGIRYLTRITLM